MEITFYVYIGGSFLDVLCNISKGGSHFSGDIKLKKKETPTHMTCKNSFAERLVAFACVEGVLFDLDEERGRF